MPIKLTKDKVTLTPENLDDIKYNELNRATKARTEQDVWAFNHEGTNHPLWRKPFTITSTKCTGIGRYFMNRIYTEEPTSYTGYGNEFSPTPDIAMGTYAKTYYNDQIKIYTWLFPGYEFNADKLPEGATKTSHKTVEQTLTIDSDINYSLVDAVSLRKYPLVFNKSESGEDNYFTWEESSKEITYSNYLYWDEQKLEVRCYESNRTTLLWTNKLIDSRPDFIKQRYKFTLSELVTNCSAYLIDGHIWYCVSENFDDPSDPSHEFNLSINKEKVSATIYLTTSCPYEQEYITSDWTAEWYSKQYDGSSPQPMTTYQIVVYGGDTIVYDNSTVSREEPEKQKVAETVIVSFYDDTGTLIKKMNYLTNPALGTYDNYADFCKMNCYIQESSGMKIADTNMTVGVNTGSAGQITFQPVANYVTRSYNVKWYDGDDNLITTTTHYWNQLFKRSALSPTKTETEQYTYTFNEQWKFYNDITTVQAGSMEEVNIIDGINKLSILSSLGENRYDPVEVTAKAQFTATTRKYKVKLDISYTDDNEQTGWIEWVDSDDNIVTETTDLAYGKELSYTINNLVSDKPLILDCGSDEYYTHYTSSHDSDYYTYKFTMPHKRSVTVDTNTTVYIEEAFAKRKTFNFNMYPGTYAKLYDSNDLEAVGIQLFRQAGDFIELVKDSSDPTGIKYLIYSYSWQSPSTGKLEGYYKLEKNTDQYTYSFGTSAEDFNAAYGRSTRGILSNVEYTPTTSRETVKYTPTFLYGDYVDTIYWSEKETPTTFSDLHGNGEGAVDYGTWVYPFYLKQGDDAEYKYVVYDDPYLTAPIPGEQLYYESHNAVIIYSNDSAKEKGNIGAVVREIQKYTVTYAAKYNGEVIETFVQNDVKYGTDVSSVEKYPEEILITTNYVYKNGTAEVKTVSGDTTVTTTYAEREANAYTVTYKGVNADPNDSGDVFITTVENVKYGTEVKSETYYPLLFTDPNNPTNIRYNFGSTETKTVTGNTTVTTTYNLKEYYCTISNVNSTTDISTGWYPKGTKIKFTYIQPSDTRIKYSSTTEDVNTDYYYETITTYGSYSTSPPIEWHKVQFNLTNCTETSYYTWLYWNEEVTFTAASVASKYKWSFSNQFDTIPTTTKTWKWNWDTNYNVFEVNISAPYKYWDTVIINEEGLTSCNYGSGYILDGTEIMFSALQDSSRTDMKRTFSSTDMTVVTYTTNVTTNGIIQATYPTMWYQCLIGAKYGTTLLSGVRAWFVAGSSINSDDYYSADPFVYDAQYTYSGKSTNTISVDDGVQEVYTTYSKQNVRSYTVTYQAVYNDEVLKSTTANKNYGTIVESSEKYGATYSTTQYTYSNPSYDSISVAFNCTVATRYATRTLNDYTLTFTTNGYGSWTNDSMSVPYGTTASKTTASGKRSVTYTFTKPDGSTVTNTYTIPDNTVSYDYSNATCSGSSNITSDKTYTGSCTATERTYTYQFQNWDGTSLEATNGIKVGEAVYYYGSAPTRDETTEYTYTFGGWTYVSGASGTFTPGDTCTGSLSTQTFVIRAWFVEHPKSYTVVVNGGTNCSISGAGEYTAGNEYTVTITADPNYVISAISGYGYVSSSSTMTVNGSSMYTTITVKGISSTAGTTITITVTDDRYYKFYFANTASRVWTNYAGKYSNNVTFSTNGWVQTTDSSHTRYYTGRMTFTTFDLAPSTFKSTTNGEAYWAGEDFALGFNSDDGVITSYNLGQLTSNITGGYFSTKTLTMWMGTGTAYTDIWLYDGYTYIEGADVGVEFEQTDTAGVLLTLNKTVGAEGTECLSAVTVTNSSTGVSKSTLGYQRFIISPYSSRTNNTITLPSDGGGSYFPTINETLSLTDYFHPANHKVTYRFYGRRKSYYVLGSYDNIFGEYQHASSYWAGASSYAYWRTSGAYDYTEWRERTGFYHAMQTCYREGGGGGGYNYRVVNPEDSPINIYTKCCKIYVYGIVNTNLKTVRFNGNKSAGSDGNSLYHCWNDCSVWPRYADAFESVKMDTSTRYLNLGWGSSYGSYFHQWMPGYQYNQLPETKRQLYTKCFLAIGPSWTAVNEIARYDTGCPNYNLQAKASGDNITVQAIAKFEHLYFDFWKKE